MVLSVPTGGALRSSSKVDGAPLVPGASGVPVVLELLNKLPVPSSLIVPTPVTEAPPVLVATKLKVSLLSPGLSFVIGVRTNKPPRGI